MCTNYLVDFENVHEFGLAGLNRLPAEDTIYIFHTSGTDRISLEVLDDVQAWVRVIRVSPGKQSLDMHLGSFLGYLMGTEKNPETKYAIISRDTDYHGIAGFWNRSWGMSNKVVCIERIEQALPAMEAPRISVTPQDAETERFVIHDFIIRTFSKYGLIGSNGLPCMRVSSLCSALNSLPEYKNALKKFSLKPREFLCTECKDFLLVEKDNIHDWAYLLAAGYEHPEEEPECEATEDEPDIMDMGDLSIDEEPELNEPAADEPEFLEETALPEGTEEEPAAPDYLAVAEECFRKADNSIKNDLGQIRVSFLRDELMQIPEFRTALKESGQKPIPFIQEYFADSLRFSREKGIWWAILAEKESPESPLAENRKKFHQEAFSNIQKRLTDAGLDKEAADEIAGIFIHSNTTVEPRKVMHNLLIQRYGTKIGSQYYRKAVKFAGM